MKTRNLVLAAALAVCFSGAAVAGDAAAGKAKAAPCMKCHEADEFAGQPVAELEATIQGIVAGKVKHKNKPALTEAEIKDVAAYFAAGK